MFKGKSSEPFVGLLCFDGIIHGSGFGSTKKHAKQEAGKFICTLSITQSNTVVCHMYVTCESGCEYAHIHRIRSL